MYLADQLSHRVAASNFQNQCSLMQLISESIDDNLYVSRLAFIELPGNSLRLSFTQLADLCSATLHVRCARIGDAAQGKP